MERAFDLIVLGGGPAGYVGAIRAAQLGAKVALVEGEQVGGTCLNVGCIPTKALVESARLYAQRKHLTQFGLVLGEVGFDLAAAMSRKESITKGLVRGLEGIFASYKIEVVRGMGRTVAPNRVQVGDQMLTAPRLLLATGSEVALPPIPGVNGPGVVTSNEALALGQVPARLAIIGGGVIGVEMAGIYAAMGTNVQVLEALPRILPTADAEAAAAMTKVLEQSGVTITAGVRVQRIEGEPGAKRVVLADGAVEADLVLVATGRRPRLAGLEALGLHTERGAVVVDATMATSVPGVAAAGDIVAGTPMLAHVAFHEAKVAVENLLGHPARMDYRAVPQCIFGPVDLAQVGLTEEAARAAGHDVKVGRFPFVANGRAATLGETRGFVKIISEARYGAVLGVHIVGHHAAELLGEATLAVQMEATLDELTETMHMHPTLSEALPEAALDALGGALHLPRANKRP